LHLEQCSCDYKIQIPHNLCGNKNGGLLGISSYLTAMKILVVDDEKDAQSLFEQRFRKEIRNGELELMFACSGQEALGVLEHHVNEQLLICSDINMPGMSGLDLLKNIKQQYRRPSPIVIMMTAYGDTDNYNNAMQLGANDFVTKPVDFPLLKEKFKSSVA
jgi:two-component system chemotaxis response regulator CheY